MDNLTKSKRSYVMSRIKGKDTKPELYISKVLKIMHFTYQPKGIYGRPDFANKKAKIAIFIDGCFWHGCPKHYVNPKSNIGYWIPKINRNIERDKEVNRHLESNGWKIIRLWEHSIIKKYQ